MTDEGKSDEREGITESASDDVEAHNLTDSPERDRADEGDDVEAHNMTDAPVDI